MDERIQDGQRHKAHADDQNGADGDLRVFVQHEFPLEDRRQRQIEAVVRERLGHAHEVLQEIRHAERRNQRHEPRRAAQRAIGHALDEHAEQPCQHQRRQQRHGERKYRPSAARRCAEQRDENLRADERAAHENFRVGKIDKMEYAVDHRVPQRDNRIHEAELQAVDEHLRQ